MAKIKNRIKLLRMLVVLLMVLIICVFISTLFGYFHNDQMVSAFASVFSGASTTQSNSGNSDLNSTSSLDELAATSTSTSTDVAIPAVTHVSVPSSVKALYMSSWFASGEKNRNKIIDLADKSEINAVVLDIKDYTGMVSFKPNSQSLLDIGCYENRITDIDNLIKILHEKNIYVIGRLATFQDPCMVKKHPEDAVQSKINGTVWKDRKGITWLDAGNQNAWNYFIDIANESYSRGFDEVQFDYIRFPTDGNMSDMVFPSINGQLQTNNTTPKSSVIENFVKYLDQKLRGGIGEQYDVNIQKIKAIAKENALAKKTIANSTSTATSVASSTDNIPVVDNTIYPKSVLGSPIYNVDEYNATTSRLMISVDVFGLVTEASGDMGIGQNLEDMLPYVDFMSPMVYPSHYATGYDGFKNPAVEPYKVVLRAMQGGVDRAKAMGQNPLKLRPWLQDFNLGATYTTSMIQDQIKATNDAGLNSWLLWDPANNYYAARGFLVQD
jgi:hypothetical protein